MYSFSWSHDYYFDARINLYDQAGKTKGEVRFFDEPHSPADSYDSANDKIFIHMPIKRYPEIIDLLRNEKPITLVFDTSKNAGYIYSGKEPVGEEET